MAAKPSHVPSLDGLRGIAALVVVFRHCWESLFLLAWECREWKTSFLAAPLNATGAVHVFFVISGFVLTSSLLRHGGTGTIQFYVRRVFRLQPPYMFGVLLAWVASGFFVVVSLDTGFTNWFRMLSSLRLSVPQLLDALSFPGSAGGLLPVGWSLWVEAIYSLLLPVLLLVARRTHWAVLLVLFPLATLAPRAPGFFGRTQLLLVSSLDFTLGMAIVLERERLARWFTAHPRLGWALALASLGLWSAPVHFTWPVVSLRSPLAYAVGGAGLVAAAAFLPGLHRGLTTRPCLFLGRISYSLYLVHLTILLLLGPYLTFWPGTWAQVVVVLTTVTGVSLVASELMYRWVERPMILAGNRVCRWVAARTGARVHVSTLSERERYRASS